LRKNHRSCVRANFGRRLTVRLSGLWNQRHVDENYDPDFLDHLAGVIDRMDGGARDNPGS
jgi:hypothetical protein